MYNTDINKGTEIVEGEEYIWKTIDACKTLLNILPQNMNEFPSMKYKDLYMLCEVLIQLKWSAVELIGRRNKWAK